MVADLLPRIERSHLWFSENVELLFCAQIAPSCHRVEGSPPVEHLPFNIEGGAYAEYADYDVVSDSVHNAVPTC